ncbi:hypothetical protein FDENT_5552 [Fusarium denticulatum]|uniref:Uncharacterized protein n=1 Tax=Fusarium denticulatum TaxID=48507 RepID=A0A8H5XAB0_9HYPO|nr:hypothetical protein FDENT_5552 [Fusarium denticulatum]
MAETLCGGREEVTIETTTSSNITTLSSLLRTRACRSLGIFSAATQYINPPSHPSPYLLSSSLSIDYTTITMPSRAVRKSKFVVIDSDEDDELMVQAPRNICLQASELSSSHLKAALTSYLSNRSRIPLLVPQHLLTRTGEKKTQKLTTWVYDYNRELPYYILSI